MSEIAPSVPATVSKSEIAKVVGLSRQTVSKYLNSDGAPEAELDGTYNPILGAYFVGVCHARSMESPAVVRMRERKMEIELAQMERAEALARRELIPKKAIQPSIASVMTRLTTSMRSVFERELPPKYQGRQVVECAEINANGVDRVLRGFKEGTDRIAEKG